MVSTNLHTLHVMYAKGDATESTSVLSMWTPVLEAMMGLPPPAKGGSMVAKRTKAVLRFLKQVIPQGQTADPRLPFLNLVLSEAVQLTENELTRATKGHPKQIVRQAENIVYYLLANALAYERKQGKHTVLFAEDVHLMDASSLEVLRKVATSLRPLLLVMSARPPPKRAQHAAPPSSGPSSRSALTAVAPPPIDDRSADVSSSEPSVSLSVSASSRASSAAGGGSDSAWADEKNSGDACEPTSVAESGQWKAHEAEEVKVPPPSADAAASTPVLPPRSLSSPPAGPSAAPPSASSSSLGESESSSVWSAQYPLFLALPDLAHLVLSGLNQTTCTRLVCQRLHANALEPSLSLLIFKRSRGNPLYAVEVASHLQENGYLLTRPQDGLCLVNPSLKDRDGRTLSVDEASMDLPTSLKGLVTRRLDSLPKKDLLVCKLASAFGYEEFERASLVELCRAEAVDEAQVALSIAALQQANILAAKEGAATLYFCHELVHSACYDLLVMSQKLKLHVRLAQLELRRHQRPLTSLPTDAANTTALSDGSGGSSPSEEAEAVTGGSGGGSFVNRLTASLRRKRGQLEDAANGGDDSAEAAASAGSLPATAAASSSSASILAALSGAELKRHASTLTYHYTMAIASYTPNASGDSTEMRQFIREAKAFLSARLIRISEQDDAADALHTAALGAHRGGLPPTPHDDGGAAPAHSTWADATATGAASASGGRPPPTPAPANPARLSWSGKARPPPPPAITAPSSTPLLPRTIAAPVPGASSRGPPPLPPPSSGGVPPSLSLSSPPSAQPPSAVKAPHLPPPALDSPARVWQAEPSPTSTAVGLQAALAPSQSPSHVRGAHSGPPPLPPSSSPSPTGEALVHVSLAQLHAALKGAGLSAELRERVVQSLVQHSRANGHSPPGPRSAPPPQNAHLSRSPPPLPAQPQPSPASSSYGEERLSRSQSALSSASVGDVYEAGVAEPSSASRSSRVPEANGAFHPSAEPSSAAPESPSTPQQPGRGFYQPPSPLSGDSAASSSLRSRSSLSRSQSFSRGPLASPGLERPASIGTPLPTPSPRSRGGGLPVPPVSVAIDSLVKLHREDVLSLRSLSRQTREPPVAVRRVVETVAALVQALSDAARAPASPPLRAPPAAAVARSWRDLLGASSFISLLVKLSPLRSTDGAGQPPPPLSAEAAAALRSAINDPMLDKAAYVRSLTPATRVLWAWTLAVCAELGVGRTEDAHAAAAAEAAEAEEVRLLSRQAVRRRARSRSQELAAPVSPHPDSLPSAAAAQSPPASPTSAAAVARAPDVRRFPGARARTAAGAPPLLAPTARAARTDCSGQTPSPHSAGGGALGGGRSRSRREALPSASTRSSQNVHLSVQAALRVRRKSTGTHE